MTKNHAGSRAGCRVFINDMLKPLIRRTIASSTTGDVLSFIMLLAAFGAITVSF